MGLFDGLKNSLGTQVKQAASKAANTAVSSAAAKAQNALNHKETFVFQSVPASLQQLSALPEADLNSPFKTAALTLAVLCNYKNNREETFKMLDFLKGPSPLSVYEKQFIRERLDGKEYKAFSFFAGASVENGYTPTLPLTITVSENPHSYPEENWAVLLVSSAGADAPRTIKLRKKPSVNKWYLNDIQCLSDIRVPAQEDPWA